MPFVPTTPATLGVPLDKPCLRMALMGFPDPYPLASLVEERQVLLPWRVADASLADAYWVCGAMAQATGAGQVRVPDRAEGFVTLDRRIPARLTFISLPVSDARIRPPYTFDPYSEGSVEYAFRQAEAVLRPLIMELLLAHRIAERMPELRARRYELSRRGKLVALIDLGGAIGLNRRLTPQDIERAEWRALRHAPGLPADFHATTFAEMFSGYVDRIGIDLLPQRYRSLPILLRTGVRIPPRAVQPVHFAILTDLSAERLTFEELQFRRGVPPELLAKALAVLFYAGAITTNPKRNRRSEVGSGESHPFSQPGLPR